MPPLARQAPVLILLTLLLHGCGWHLRGAPAFSGLEGLNLSGGSQDLRHHLSRELDAVDVRVTDSAPRQLRIESERWSRRTIAVDSQGRAAEISLTLRLGWQLFSEKGKALAPHRKLSVTRTFHYNTDSATASSDEEELLRESIYRDAVWQIMRQLEATVSQLPEATEKTGEPQG